MPKRETASYTARLCQEARSENDHVVASANGWGCMGTKRGNMQGVSQPGGNGSTIGPKAPQNTQARASKGTAPLQARAYSKKSLRHGKTPSKGINRRRACTECAFRSKTTVKDEPGRSGLHAFHCLRRVPTCTRDKCLLALRAFEVLRVDVRSLFGRDVVAAVRARSV